jgi:hypothetical protein
LYGEEVVIPKEIKLGSLRADQELKNEEDANLTIDMREEDKLQALSNIEKYQDETRKWRNKRVCEEKNIYWRNGATKKNKGSGQIRRKMGRPLLGIRNKAGGLHITNIGGRRGTILVESA